MKRICSVTVLALAFVFTICSVQRVSALDVSLGSYQQELSFRESGLAGDHSQVPAMLAVLKEQAPVGEKWTILLALAQLGDMSALPDIDAFVKYNDVPDDKLTLAMPLPYPDQNLAACAKAARARLLAENGEARNPREKVQRFYQELGITPIQLNETMLQQKTNAARSNASNERFMTSFQGYALRQLADMILHGNYSDYAKLPGVANIDFSTDYRAYEKWSLAQVPVGQRVSYLINRLASPAGVGFVDQQLLMNLGRSTITAPIYAKLQQMFTEPTQYRVRDISDLLQVLKASGDLTLHQPYPEMWERVETDPRLRPDGLTTDRVLSFTKKTTFDDGD